MNFVDLRLYKPEELRWEHESINSLIFTKMDIRRFSFKATIYNTTTNRSCWKV